MTGVTASSADLRLLFLVLLSFLSLVGIGVDGRGRLGELFIEALEPEITLTSSALMRRTSTKLRMAQVLDGVIYIRPL